MEHWLEQIVETDRLAGEKTADARRRQAEADTLIEQQKQQLHDEYIQRARHRLQVLEDKESELVQQTLAAFEETTRRQTERLEAIAREHREEWIADVAARALEEDAPC